MSFFVFPLMSKVYYLKSYVYHLLEANQLKKADTVDNYLKAYWAERRALRDNE